MSGDNYFIVRTHPNGGYGLVQGFTSDDEMGQDLSAVKPESTSWPTVLEAMNAAPTSEYGTEIHSECKVITATKTQITFSNAQLQRLLSNLVVRMHSLSDEIMRINWQDDGSIVCAFRNSVEDFILVQ